LRPQKDNLLKIKKYITAGFLVKMGLFLVLLGGAWLFDHFHQRSPVSAEQSKPVESRNTSGLISFFCTPPATVSLKAPLLKTTCGKIFREKLNLLLTGQLNARSYYSLKAESLKQPHSLLGFRNLHCYRYHFLHHPDDQPPVC
jgi:hypothetical protein